MRRRDFIFRFVTRAAHTSTVVSKSGLTIRRHRFRDLTSQKPGGYIVTCCRLSFPLSNQEPPDPCGWTVGEADSNSHLWYDSVSSVVPLYLCYLEPADTSIRHNLFGCWTRPRTRWYKIKSKWVLLSWTVAFKKMWIFHLVFKSLKNNIARNSDQVLMNTDVTLQENSHPQFWEAQCHLLFTHRDICCQVSD